MAINLKSIPEGAIKIVEVIWGYDTSVDYVDFEDVGHEYIDDSNRVDMASLWLTLDNKYFLYAGDQDMWLDPEKDDLIGWIQAVSNRGEDYYRCHKEIYDIAQLKTAIESGNPSPVEENREFEKIVANSTKLIEAISVSFGKEYKHPLYITNEGQYILDDVIGSCHDDVLDWIDDLFPSKYAPMWDKYICYNNTDILALRAKLIASTNQIRLDEIPSNAMKLIKVSWVFSQEERYEILWRTNGNRYLIDDGRYILEESPSNIMQWIEQITDKEKSHLQKYKCYKKTNIDKLKKELMGSIND